MILCIYCMGEYGLQTYFKLSDAGIKVDYFGDRDPNKQGYAIDGIYCLSYDEIVSLDKNETAIIVAVKNPESLISDFIKHGFEKVWTIEEALNLVKDNQSMSSECISDTAVIENMKKGIVDVFYGYENTVNLIEGIECRNMLIDYVKRTARKAQ